MTTRRLLAVPLLVLALAPACGIDAEPRAIAVDSAALPAEQTPAEAVEEEAPEASVVYLVVGERLQAVPRARRPTVAAALVALLEGPRDTEAAAGIRSAIPAGTELLGATITDGEIRIDLSEEFTTIVGEEHLLALAQLVYTATDAGDVDRVSIAIEGTAVPVSRADGQLSTGAVTPADYVRLAPA